MSRMREMAYHRPRTLEEAFACKAETPGARWITGGTDLLVHLRKRRVAPPPALVSLRGVEELRSIEVRERGAGGRDAPRAAMRGGAPAPGMRIGAAVPVADIARHPWIRERFPALVASIAVLGSRQIQNVATLAGNLCNASPAADTAPPLLVAGARVALCGPGGSRREMDLEEFILGPARTALGPDEILAAVLLDAPPPGARETFLRRGRVAMDLAIASVAARVVRDDGGTCHEARLAAGAVAPVPLRLRAAEAAVEGSLLDDAAIQRARAAAEEAVHPITDLRSSADYRRSLTGVFVTRALARLRGARRSDA